MHRHHVRPKSLTLLPYAPTETEDDVKVNPQRDCPLFSRIPPEIRNDIFSLVLTAHEDKSKPYHPRASYYRPGFRCVQKVDTALLRTCRRVNNETKNLPSSLNELTIWCFRGPPPAEIFQFNNLTNREFWRLRKPKVIHVFVQQFWLEDRFGGFSNFADTLQTVLPILRPPTLKITIRHSDWWWWERAEPLALDPKRAGKPSPLDLSEPLDSFAKGSWGKCFESIAGLEIFELELETLESKKHELDGIVERASAWEFILEDKKKLILDKAKTRRNGWVGYKIDTRVDLARELVNFDGDSDIAGNTVDGSFSESVRSHRSHFHGIPYLPVAPLLPTPAAQMPVGPSASGSTSTTAKERLLESGVKFDERDPNLPESRSLTYYVVSLTWTAHPL